jgi:hypothetical protein
VRRGRGPGYRAPPCRPDDCDRSRLDPGTEVDHTDDAICPGDDSKARDGGLAGDDSGRWHLAPGFRRDGLNADCC